MSNQIVNDILEKRLNTEWVNRTPIAWDNLDYTPVRGEAFIRSILEAIGSDLMGITCLRVDYLYTIQVFTPSNEGVTSNLILADYVTAIFKNFGEGHLTVHQIATQRVGDEEEWHQRNVLIDVTYDNIT